MTDWYRRHLDELTSAAERILADSPSSREAVVNLLRWLSENHCADDLAQSDMYEDAAGELSRDQVALSSSDTTWRCIRCLKATNPDYIVNWINGIPAYLCERCFREAHRVTERERTP